MAYEVLARKWRPKTFDDVMGQDHITRTLANAIAQDRIAHAYLFIGSRGIGKTTLSRIFAMALNCEHGPTSTPCGVCENCKGIATGTSLDVTELDAASHNGVEDIRALCDQVQFAPVHGKFRIFIIDEVHMLSLAAFNALLKTLEEPPPYVKFIFATTEGDKVLPTIISRCQRFDLRRITVGDIVKRLRFICNAEEIKVTEDALLAIARGANGGLRDALSALDQLIAFKGNDLNETDVLAVFGLVSREALESLAGAILNGDIPTLLQLIEDFNSTGKDMRRFTAELLWHFRNLLVYQQAGAELAKQDVTAEQLEVLKTQSKMGTPARIIEITTLLSDMESKLRLALSVRTLVEMTLIRCARAAKTVSLDEVLRKLTELRTQTIQRLAVAAPQGSTTAAAASQEAAPLPSREVKEPLSSFENDADDDSYSLCENSEGDAVPEVPPLKSSTPIVHVETLRSATDGKYVDEILNHAIRLFGGGPV
ncbi:MAG: DNA polymerase III subunit gamma/tau [Kiritimatiellia bacterium]